MAATKITINSNGSIRVEGDFEIVDPQGQPFDLGGADTVVARALPAAKPKV